MMKWLWKKANHAHATTLLEFWACMDRGVPSVGRVPNMIPDKEPIP